MVLFFKPERREGGNGSETLLCRGSLNPLFPFFSPPFTVTSSGSYRHIERYVLTERKATTSFVCPPSVSLRRSAPPLKSHTRSVRRFRVRIALFSSNRLALLFTWRLVALRRVRDFETAAVPSPPPTKPPSFPLPSTTTF